MTSRRPRRCITYETFGDCKDGDACEMLHEVRPSRIRKVFVIVALDNLGISGIVSFHPMERDSTTKRQYYLSKNKWFRSGAVHGDIVELHISDKRHIGNCRFARITKVLQRNNSILTPIGSVNCLTYATYGDCSFGYQCSFSHWLSVAVEQYFYIARVLSITNLSSDGGCVVHVTQINDNGGIVETKYYLPRSDSWHLGNAAKGNLVIMQQSERTVLIEDEGLMHYGKVSAILHKTQSLDAVSIPLEGRTRRGFALEAPGSKSRCIVNSLSDCTHKKKCKRIGIHVLSAALGSHFDKLDHLVAPYPHHLNYPRMRDFDPNMIRLTLSVYIHTSCSDVEGPMITPVLVPSEQIFIFDQDQNDANKYIQYLDILWRVFGTRLLEDVAKSSIASFMVDFPGTWKERYIIHQMKISYSRRVTAFLRSRNKLFVIARNISTNIRIPHHEEILVPADVLDGVKSVRQPLHGDETVPLAFLLGSAKRGVITFWEDHLTDWYVKEIFPCKQVPDDKLVITTSPVWQTNDFVNQQITLASMISAGASVYSKSEMLGILGRRLETPTILKTVIRNLTSTRANLQFCGKYGVRQGNRKVPLRILFPGSITQLPESNSLQTSQDHNDHADKVSILVEGLTCKEYCNSVSVRLSEERVSALADSVIELGVEAAGTEQKIAELFAVDYESPAPYESCDGDTKITLRCGVELQLQVSMEKDSDESVSETLRLLKIGENCHLCLHHLNNPMYVFSSDRSDVRELITKPNLIELTKQIAENHLQCDIHEGLEVEWNDIYFSGGRFSTFGAGGNTKPGDFLCIRKEIARPESEDSYVWTCHAVVSEVCEYEAKFLVCGLSQEQTSGVWEDGDNRFIIEVLHVACRHLADTETSA